MNIKHENESKIYLVSHYFPDTGKLDIYQPRYAIRTPLPAGKQHFVSSKQHKSFPVNETLHLQFSY